MTKHTAPNPSASDQLEARRRRLERGDTLEILHAIKLCAYYDVPLPSWLSHAYCEKFDAFMRTGSAASLDEVFYSAEIPTNTAKKRAQVLQQWQVGRELWAEVRTVANNG